jgi:hypothetical protein
MVVRYPHSATVHVVTTTITDGEYASESDVTQVIKGRLEYSAARRIEKAPGEYTDISATFFTIVKSVTGAKTLMVGSVTFVIIRWVDYQNYSEIWLE